MLCIPVITAHLLRGLLYMLHVLSCVLVLCSPSSIYIGLEETGLTVTSLRYIIYHEQLNEKADRRDGPQTYLH